MNLHQQAAEQPSFTKSDEQSYSLASTQDVLMSAVERPEKSGPLRAHEDARSLVRLIQCMQCSRPYRSPVTLPCGNSLCRECLPEAYQRERISYPDLPARRHAFRCPFLGCAEEHPAADCNMDVTLTKVMDSIAEVVAKHTSFAVGASDPMEDVTRWDEGVSLPTATEKTALSEIHDGRLIATYSLAVQGHLSYQEELDYRPDDDVVESERATDTIVLSDLLESTYREVDCQVCYHLMLDPVTTFCGHTLCRKCLTRALDHSPHCPVCRRGLAIPPSLLTQSSNKTLVNLLEGLCPDAVASRAETVAQEEQGSEGDMSVPLFVCTLGFPNQPTFLRIFEPRYRLMLRRCIEGNREFGMLMYNRYLEPQGELGAVHFYHYGTMLHIIHSQLLPDGTSLVETRGLYRFRVKAHGTVDGYTIGSVERMDDVTLAEEERIEAEETSRPPVEEEDVVGAIDRMSTQDLLALGRNFISRMQARSANWLQQRVLDIHGQPPDDPALFPYWFASVLPISDEEKYKLLGTSTVRERLKITASWIRRIESQRWTD